MNITEEIKTILFNCIEKEYHNYLNINKILLIKQENLKDNINKLYENNNKTIKNTIRTTLKDKYKDNYPNATVENLLFDIFQDQEFNIIRLLDEIHLIQRKNHKLVEIPIINNSLNLNISIIDNYIVINSVNSKNIENYNEIYESIDNYKFIYSINDKILEEYDNTEKINIIKSEIQDKKMIEIGLYYLKKNCKEKLS